MTARQLYKRRFGRKRRTRRHKGSKYQRAVKVHNRKAYKAKHSYKAQIQRPIGQNFVIRNFSVLNFGDYSMQYFNAQKGAVAVDYTWARIMSQTDYNYYKGKYYWGNILTFTVTFFLNDTVNIQQRWDVGSTQAQIATTQIVDTREQLVMYVGHFNSHQTQDGYKAIFDADTNIAHQQLHNRLTPKMQRLRQNNHVTFKWALPPGYRSTYMNMPATEFTHSLDDDMNGPPGDEPHGFVFWFPLYGQYANVPQQLINIGYRIDTTMCFKDIQPRD